MRLNLLVALALFIAPIAAHADTIDQVSGTLLIAGNTADETISFVFDTTPGFYPGADQFNESFTAISTTESGPLTGILCCGNTGDSQVYGDTLSLSSGCPAAPVAQCTEIDLAYEFTQNGSGGWTLAYLDPEWWQCSGTCAQYFTPTGTNSYGLDDGDYSPITLEDLTVTDPPATATPEPSSLLLLGMGLVGVMLLSSQLLKRGRLRDA